MLLQVGLFLVIFVVFRAIAEPIVRLRLIAILGDLAGGVLIGVSGLHLIVLPETHAQISGPALLARLVGGHQAQRGAYRFQRRLPQFPDRFPDLSVFFALPHWPGERIG